MNERQRIEQVMASEKLSANQFAKEIGVKQSQVSEWLKGKAKPGYDTLRKMSLTFGVSADYFLGIKE